MYSIFFNIKIDHAASETLIPLKAGITFNFFLYVRIMLYES
jgi:hypothetical protein